MSQDGLDDRNLIPQFVKSGRREVSDSVKTESLYTCSVAEPPHELEPFQERLSVIFVAELGVIKAKENVRLSLDGSVLPPPKQGLSQLAGHRNPVVFEAPIFAFSGGQA